MNFKLAAPVEAVLPLPSGTTIVGAAGEKIAVLDLVAARPLQLLHNHQKAITALSLATQGKRLLTGALDGHVKVFDTATWTVVAGFKYPSPVLSLAVVGGGAERDDRHLCVGMESGLLSIRTKLSASAKAAKRDREKEMDALMSGTIEAFDAKRARKDKKKQKKQGAGWAARIRGKDYTGEAEDIVIDPRVSTGALRGTRNSAAWENALRRGAYARALDLALDSRDRAAILTLLTALVHRSALRTALAKRNAAGVLPVLRWLQRNVADPRCTRLTTEVATVLVEEYAEHAGQSRELDEGIERLHEEVRTSTEMAQMALSTVGMLDLLQAGTG
jgi:U3 small nucleolar RNA-associated protein 15